MTFEEALGRFTSVNIKDITGIEEVSEPENNQSFSILLKGFLFFINYFSEKEGFLYRLVVYIK